jgi:ribonuclease P/MRP protein subunit POP5
MDKFNVHPFFMAKIKTLRPSLREKKRYVAFEILSNKSFSARDITAGIRRALSKALGTIGLAGAGVLFVPPTIKDNMGIFRVNHNYVDAVRASFALATEVAGDRVVIRTIGVSGILKKVKMRILER